jgi:hypothetical protein
MQDTGHSEAQAPQAMQSSVILNAMVSSSIYKLVYSLYHNFPYISTGFKKKSEQI